MVPFPSRVLAVLALGAALALAPGAAHAESSAEFHARMLAEHGGVFVDEDLGGVVDRAAVAEETARALTDHGLDVDVLVVDEGDAAELGRIASRVHRVGGRPLLVLSTATPLIGYAGLVEAVLPQKAVEYTAYTGAAPEHPADTVEALAEARGMPDLADRHRRSVSLYAREGPGHGLPLTGPEESAWNTVAVVAGAVCGILLLVFLVRAEKLLKGNP